MASYEALLPQCFRLNDTWSEYLQANNRDITDMTTLATLGPKGSDAYQEIYPDTLLEKIEWHVGDFDNDEYNNDLILFYGDLIG